ncbi:MAG: EAL domain-containing protein, partial [Acidimicrobiales bacterium]|nr:EAL domain-containing protein [Acidimicrobiales bacterium]
GYSSLSYVRRFSLDMLKIDKSFIDGVDSSPEDRAIVEHVVGMAQALGMITVAEGIERPEQLQWLRRLGCRLAQGYVLSRPIPGEDFEAILSRHEADPFGIMEDRAPAPSPAPAAALPPAPAADHDPASVGPLEFVAPTEVAAPAPTEPSPEEELVGALVDGAPAAPAPPSTAAGNGSNGTSSSGNGNGSNGGARDGAPPTLPRLREYRPAED